MASLPPPLLAARLPHERTEMTYGASEREIASHRMPANRMEREHAAVAALTVCAQEKYDFIKCKKTSNENVFVCDARARACVGAPRIFMHSFSFARIHFSWCRLVDDCCCRYCCCRRRRRRRREHVYWYCFAAKNFMMGRRSVIIFYIFNRI